MSSKPQDFAQRVLAAFEQAGLFTDVEVSRAGGPSTTFMTMLRKVRDGEESAMPENGPRGDTMFRIDLAADWEPGSARALWAKGTKPKARSRPDFVFGDHVVEAKRYRPPATPGSLDQILDELFDRVVELEERLDVVERNSGVSDPGEVGRKLQTGRAAARRRNPQQ